MFEDEEKGCPLRGLREHFRSVLVIHTPSNCYYSKQTTVHDNNHRRPNEFYDPIQRTEDPYMFPGSHGYFP